MFGIWEEPFTTRVLVDVKRLVLPMVRSLHAQAPEEANDVISKYFEEQPCHKA